MDRRLLASIYLVIAMISVCDHRGVVYKPVSSLRHRWGYFCMLLELCMSGLKRGKERRSKGVEESKFDLATVVHPIFSIFIITISSSVCAFKRRYERAFTDPATMPSRRDISIPTLLTVDTPVTAPQHHGNESNVLGFNWKHHYRLPCHP